MEKKTGITDGTIKGMAKVMATHDLNIILNTDEPHLRTIIDMHLSLFKFTALGKKALREVGAKTVGELVSKWPLFVEACAKHANTYTEFMDAKDVMESIFVQIGFPIPLREGLTPTADRLEKNACLSDQALCIGISGNLAKDYEEEYKVHPEKFKDVTQYDENCRPYYQKKDGKRFYMPNNYTDEEYSHLSETEREEDRKLWFDGGELQYEGIYMFVDLQVFMLDIEEADL